MEEIFECRVVIKIHHIEHVEGNFDVLHVGASDDQL